MEARLSDISRMFSLVTGKSDAAAWPCNISSFGALISGLCVHDKEIVQALLLYPFQYIAGQAAEQVHRMITPDSHLQAV